MYAADAIGWLQQFGGHSTLARLGRLDVAPVLAPGSSFLSGTDEHSLAAFGFGADGAMKNGTYLFALVVLVLYAVVQRTTVPPLLVKFLQAIPVQQKRADSSASRIVESMVTSAVQSMPIAPLTTHCSWLRSCLAMLPQLRPVAWLALARPLA